MCQHDFSLSQSGIFFINKCHGTFCGRVDLAETAFTIVVMFSLENPLLSSELFQKFKTSKQVILRWQPVSIKAPFFYFEDNNV